MTLHLRHYYDALGRAYVICVDEQGSGHCVRCLTRIASDEDEAARLGFDIGQGEPEPEGSIVVVCGGCRVSGDAELPL